MVLGRLRSSIRDLRVLGMDEKWRVLDKIMRGVSAWKLPAGDYLEFGVYRGLSFVHAYERAQRYGLGSMKFYAFDSFEGLPEDFDAGEKNYKHFEPNQFACGQGEFKGILKRAGVDMGKVSLVPGFYDKSLTPALKRDLPIKRAAVVWIDCDLYSSTVPVLRFINDYLTTGSIIAFDDWFSFGADPKVGELRATEEWLAENPEIRLVEYHKFHTAGISYIVQKS